MRLPVSALIVSLVSLTAHATPREIVIFHTSDVHGGYASRPAAEDPPRARGGYAVLASLVKAETRPHLLLDSGDVFQGTPEGNLTRGRASIDLMNAVGYHAMVIGNHEYDYGEANLKDLIALARFPVLAANIFRKRDGVRVEYAQPTTAITVGGVRVGIVGLATRHTTTSTLPRHVKHLRFGDEAAHAREHAERLRREGATVVVALTHCGLAPSQARTRVDPDTLTLTRADVRYGGDLLIARAAPVDAVLGGHTHVGLSKTWRDPVSGVPIVQSYQNLEAVSRVTITVDEAGKPQHIDAALVDLWVDKYGEDPQILDRVKQHGASVAEAMSEVLGAATAPITRADERLDTPLGNWLTDVLRQAAGADVAVQNTYGIRADLPAGPLTMRHLYEVMPFENTLVTTRLTGHQLRRLLRDNLRGGKTGLQLSGLTVRYRQRPDGTVSDLRVRVNGEPLRGAHRYRVATNNYLAQGGTGGQVFTGATVTDTGRPIRELFIEAVRQGSPLSPPPTGRIQPL